MLSVKGKYIKIVCTSILCIVLYTFSLDGREQSLYQRDVNPDTKEEEIKAATSMWIRIFFEFSNLTYIKEIEAHRRAAIKFSASKHLNEINNSVWITVVRHPFT
ncbi:hypothetical protein Avbf_13633, partial [Armadillidium vulgare]